MHEVLGWRGPMTHRQFLAWQVWLRSQWDRPDRADHYQMQTAAEVRRVGASFAEKPPKVKIDDFKLSWGTSEYRPSPAKKMTQAEDGDRAKRTIMAYFGMSPDRPK